MALECGVVVALAAAAFWYGRFASLNALTPPDYHYLTPAVAVAVGKGFNAPHPIEGSPLAEFIAGRAPSVTWAEASAMDVGPPDQFHQSARYLINVVGYWWRIRGLSWAGIADVAGGLHVMAVLGSYFLLRLCVPLPLALLGALWMCTSTLQLALVPHVRDYSKGAFMYGVLPLVVMLALHQMSKRRLLTVAAAAGALIGLSLGFKMDVAIMAPLAVACIVVFRGARPWTGLADKARATAVLAAALAIAAGPVLYRLSSDGSNAVHVVLLGYTDGFDTNLGIAGSAYSFLPFYSDEYVVRIVQGHSGLDHWLQFPSAESDRAGQALWFDLIRNFPADVLARALAAGNTVMNLCFTSRDPSFLTKPLPAQPFFVGLYAWMSALNGLGLMVAALFVGVASWSSLRRGALAALLLLVLASYPSLQFESRHYFHTQIVPVVAILVLVWAVIAAVVSRVRPLRAPAGAGGAARGHGAVGYRLAGAAVLMALLTVAPLSALRAYQAGHLQQVLTRYLATRAQLQTEVVPEGDVTLIRWAPTGATGPPELLRTDHFVVEFADGGTALPINVGVRYDAVSPQHDYSRVLSLQPAPGANRVGFSVFNVAGQSEFAGIELGEASRRRLTGVYRVASGGPAGLPLDVRLPGDWSSRRLFQRLLLEGSDPRAVTQRRVLCAAAPGCLHLLGYVDRIGVEPLRVSPGAISMVHAEIAQVADAIRIDGRVENESSYLVQFKDQTMAGRSAFVAQGYLTRGGVAIGLLKNRVWYKQAIVNTIGEFAVVVAVDDAGVYTPLITNAMPAGQRENHVVIAKAGFLEPR